MKILVSCILCFLLFGCKSNVDKKISTIEDLSEQYIKDLENAQNKEEVLEINRKYKERKEFEVSKLTDSEKEEYLKNLTWEKKEELEIAAKHREQKEREARQRAKERLNKTSKFHF